MKKIKFIIIIFLLSANFAMGQLLINSSVTANQMVQNFVGTGVTISNITYTGGVNSKGTFSNGNTTNLSLSNGIILCTGTASQIANPASYFMSTNLGLVGDANLNAINNSCLTYDACKLEFDFVPISDTIKFKYVFGSEEYPNFICSQYQDIFAFFVTGANPAGGNYTNYNIALIPGTNIPVSVNSVNSGTPGGSYSASGCLSLAYSSLFVNNAAINGTTIAFGGFTKPLIASCKVVPCQTYHLKMAVADGYNGLYDSGVFLEASSFSTNAFLVSNIYSDTALGHNAIKGCSDGKIVIKTTYPATSPLVINYTIGGTAVNGTDYTAIPDSVTIPTGQDSTALIIHPFDNGSTGNKTVILTITNGCTTIKDTIYIIDKVNINLNPSNDTTICIGNNVVLHANASGGVSPIIYNWSPLSSTGSTINTSPTGTTTYFINVTDHCLSTMTDSILVTVLPMPVVNLGNDTTICQGDPLTLNAGNPSLIYTWSTGATTQQINITNTGTYWVKVSNGSCFATDTIHVNVIPFIIVNLGNDTTICQGATTTLNANNPGAIYLWNTGATTQQIPVNSVGSYWVKVNIGNCSNSDTISINISPIPIVNLGNDTTLCLGDPFVLDANNAGATYLWSTGATTQQINITTQGIYSVKVINYSGCVGMDTVQLLFIPLSVNLGIDTSFCIGDTINLNAANTGSIYLWNTGATTQTIKVWNAGSYWVNVVDGTCHNSDTINITFFQKPTVYIGRDTVMCPGDLIILNADVGYTAYLWSNGSTQAFLNVNNPGNYWVSVSNGGCYAIDSIHIAECNSEIWMPNCFTPNDDGINDTFYPVYTNVQNISMYIYNRWGNLIFEGSGKNTIWDGRYQGKMCPDGVYYCLINYSINNDRIQRQLHGSITLLK
ncbi:MAG: choice-of-anchor L domain-containing protein [Bacteroidota bacterium]